MAPTPQRHVLLAIDSLSGRGSEKSVINLAEALLQLGHKVNIVIYEDIVEFDIDSRINIYRLKPLSRPYRRILSRLTDYENVRLFKSLLNHIQTKQGYIDLIVSALPRIDRILSLIKDCRIYHVIHSPLSLQNGIRKNSWHKKLSRIWHMKRMYDGRKIISVSQGVGDDLIRFVKVRPSSIQTIYNPFNFGKLKALSSRPFTSLMGILPEDYFLHIGAFTLREKRQDLLIQAFALSGLKCKLVLLGKGKDEEKIRDLIKYHSLNDQVILAGFQSNPYPWIKHARLLVLSSYYEGFGNVLIEALALNTPVLSTDCGGPSEILFGSMRECLTPNGDVKALAEKMRTFFESPPLIDTKKIKRYEAKIVAKEYLKLIHS